MNQLDQYLVDIFKSLAHPIRINILKILKDGPKCVCEILPLLDSEQSNASQHLTVLKNSGVIGRWKEGTQVMYGVLDQEVYQLMGIAQSILVNQLERAKDAILSGE